MIFPAIRMSIFVMYSANLIFAMYMHLKNIYMKKYGRNLNNILISILL